MCIYVNFLSAETKRSHRQPLPFLGMIIYDSNQSFAKSDYSTVTICFFTSYTVREPFPFLRISALFPRSVISRTSSMICRSSSRLLSMSYRMISFCTAVDFILIRILHVIMITQTDKGKEPLMSACRSPPFRKRQSTAEYLQRDHYLSCFVGQACQNVSLLSYHI